MAIISMSIIDHYSTLRIASPLPIEYDKAGLNPIPRIGVDRGNVGFLGPSGASICIYIYTAVYSCSLLEGPVFSLNH